MSTTESSNSPAENLAIYVAYVEVKFPVTLDLHSHISEIRFKKTKTEADVTSFSTEAVLCLS